MLGKRALNLVAALRRSKWIHKDCLLLLPRQQILIAVVICLLKTKTATLEDHAEELLQLFVLPDGTQRATYPILCNMQCLGDSFHSQDCPMVQKQKLPLFEGDPKQNFHNNIMVLIIR